MRDDTLLSFSKSYFYLKRLKNCFINKILATGVWPVHWIAGSQVFNGSIGVFNCFDFSWILALTQHGLFSVHGSTRSGFRFGPGLKIRIRRLPKSLSKVFRESSKSLLRSLPKSDLDLEKLHIQKHSNGFKT